MQETYFARRFLLPILAIAFLTIATLAGFLVWSANGIDAAALEREKTLLNRAMDEQRYQIEIIQQQLVESDQAARDSDPDNIDWLAQNLPSLAHEFYGHDFSAIFDRNLQPVLGLRSDATLTAAQTSSALSGIAPLLEKLEGLPADTEIQQVVDAMLVEGVPALVAIMTIPATGQYYASAVSLAADMAEYLGDQYQVDNLYFTTDPAAGRFDAALPVDNAEGTTIAWLVWDAASPGLHMLKASLPALILALLIGTAIVVKLLSSLRSALFQLEIEREDARHQALHDALTGLPNRSLFEIRLNQALSAETEADVAVMALDLDKFKQVNDTMGHPAGDELLKQVAQRLTKVVGPEMTVARMGGDEFTIILPSATANSDALVLAKAIRENLRQPFHLPQGTAHIGVSIGIATAAKSADDSTSLLKNADDALYRAKQAGRDQYSVFTASGDQCPFPPAAASLHTDVRASAQGS